MLRINSHSIQISIAEYVEEMVRDPNPMPFSCYFLFFSFFMCFLLNNHWNKDYVQP